MNSLVLPLTAIVLFAFAYRYYVAFVATKVARVDPSRPTPAVTQADGRDFVKTNKYVLFGHHFAAISASGPLIGPVLAAQFGYLPGALWILFGAPLILLAVFAGPWLVKSQFASWFTFQPKTLALMLPVYGFIAATLPVWLLLCPRDYLSTYMKIGTIVLLVVGVAIVHPKLLMPAVTPYVNGTGPVLPGMKVFPFCFIVIACGAISGFHSLIGSGPTPRMIPNEGSIKFIGAGAMLTEGVVAIMALVAATTLHPADYYLINGVPKAVAALGIQPAQLNELTRLVGEGTLQGPTGGAVSLAVGMANILRQIPGMGHLMAYWYHFAIMFEAVFILTALGNGTRVAP